jgi:uncharacterized protein with HEPN domain
MNNDDRWRLGHIADSLRSAMNFVRDRQRDDLDKDEMLVFALMRAIEVAGEAASKISAEGRNELPDLPWPEMIGMRNRLVHAYFSVDLNILWDTVIRAVPPLAARINEFLQS